MEIYNVANQILRKMPTNLSKLEQARYVYLELGKMFTFDEEYWFANSKMKNRMFKSHQNIKEFKQLPNRKIICVSLANLYNSIMNELGIEAEIETIPQKRKDENPHVYSVITIDGIRYKADLQRDLKYIQTKRRTRRFGQDMDFGGAKSITPEELEQIDKKLGYSYDGDRFLNDLIIEVKKSRKLGERLEKRVKGILDKIGECETITKMGYIEKIEIYQEIFSKVLEENESKKVKYTDMYLEKGQSRHYTQCISVCQKNNKYSRFIYSEKTGKYLPIEDEKMRELVNQGLKTVGEKKIPGLSRKKRRDIEEPT